MPEMYKTIALLLTNPNAGEETARALRNIVESDLTRYTIEHNEGVNLYSALEKVEYVELFDTLILDESFSIYGRLYMALLAIQNEKCEIAKMAMGSMMKLWLRVLVAAVMCMRSSCLLIGAGFLYHLVKVALDDYMSAEKRELLRLFTILTSFKELDVDFSLLGEEEIQGEAH